MYRTSIFLCVLPTVISIIVRDPPPSPSDYKYSYNIEDPTTGDKKSQHEVRQGDVVSGAYTVLGPDGTKRTVEYTADSKHGFQAVISEEPAEVPAVTSPQPIVRNDDYAHYYYKQISKPVYSPVSPAPYYLKNYEAQVAKAYFIPSNEIKTERQHFDEGQYFIPRRY